MATIIQKKRLTNEVKLLSQQPLHYCTAYPDETNPLIWYFLIVGQKGTDYYGGEYIGKIVHSPKYPAEPPDYYMLTPSGRYDVGKKICLTNSSYHKCDWSSTWNILSILIAFYSIWLDDKEHGISHITDTPANRKRMAAESIEYNKKNNSSIYSKFDRSHLKDDAPVVLKKKVSEQNQTEPEPVKGPVVEPEQEPVKGPVVEQEPEQEPVKGPVQVGIVGTNNKIHVEQVNEPEKVAKTVKKSSKKT